MKHLLLISILLIGCNAEKRCINHKNKALAGGCLELDTFFLTDTVKGFQIDTVVQFDTTTKTDTLVVEKNGIKTVTVLKWKDRIVEQTITQRDTIRYIQKPIIKEVCPECPKPSWWWNFWQHVGLMSFIIVLISSVAKIIINKFK